jgi:hypothetical protein
MLVDAGLEVATVASTGAPRSGHGGSQTSESATEELIGRVDVRELAGAGDRFQRVVAPHFAEEIALGRHVRQLLASGRWEQIHIVPHRDGDVLSDHVFDLYGVPLTARG